MRETRGWREVAILEHKDNVLSIAFSPDGRFLASGCRNRTVKILLVGVTWPEFATLRQGRGVYSVSFSPHGTLLAVGCEDGTVNIWEVGSRSKIAYWKHGNWLTSVDFSPNGIFLASGGNEENNGTIKIWDAGSWTERVTLPYPGQTVFSVAFSPDGRFLASGSGFGYTTLRHGWEWKGGEVKVWEVGSWQEVATLGRSMGVVMSVTFTSDGKFLVAGSFDGTVKVWEVGSWQEVTTLSGRHVYSVCFSPNGKFLALGNADGTVKLWRVVGLQTPVKKPLARQQQVVISQSQPVYKKLGGQGTIVGMKNPVVAGLLSFFLPGVGQIYNGQTAKGFLILLIYLLFLVEFRDGLGIAHIISAVDAIMIARKLQQGQAVSPWEWS